MRPVAWLSLLLVWLSVVAPARAEDGYELWLRYRPVEARALDAYRGATTTCCRAGTAPSSASRRRNLSTVLMG